MGSKKEESNEKKPSKIDESIKILQKYRAEMEQTQNEKIFQNSDSEDLDWEPSKKTSNKQKSKAAKKDKSFDTSFERQEIETDLPFGWKKISRPRKSSDVWDV